MNVVGNLVSGWFGAQAASKQADAAAYAADTSAAGTRYAADVQREMFDKSTALQEPWRQAGVASLNALSGGLAPGGELMRDFSMRDYTADPGYAFRLSEGQKALERSAAARGGLLSGAALKGITRFGQDYGSQEYQNAYNRFQANQSNKFNRLASVAGIGQTATNALQTAGQGYGSNVGNLAMQGATNQANAALAGGQARASAYQGWGNALGRIDWGKVNMPSFGSSGSRDDWGTIGNPDYGY